MAGKIWYYDCYDLRKFNVGEIDTFVDIGSNNGSVSLMMKILQPRARIVALEPAKETFEELNLKLLCWKKINIEAYNVALGDGNPMCFQNRGHSGMNRFFGEEEKDWWPEGYEYVSGSKTFPQIFSEYNIDTQSPYIVKIDCEGGERYILKQEEESLPLFRNAVQVVMEIHLGLGGTGEEWNNFFQKLMDTHEFRIGNYLPNKKDPNTKFMYYPVDKFEAVKGTHAIELISRDWIGPFPGKGK